MIKAIVSSASKLRLLKKSRPVGLDPRQLRVYHLHEELYSDAEVNFELQF